MTFRRQDDGHPTVLGLRVVATITVGTVIHVFMWLVSLLGIIWSVASYKQATQDQLDRIADRQKEVISTLHDHMVNTDTSLSEMGERISRIEGKLDPIAKKDTIGKEK